MKLNHNTHVYKGQVLAPTPAGYCWTYSVVPRYAVPA